MAGSITSVFLFLLLHKKKFWPISKKIIKTNVLKQVLFPRLASNRIVYGTDFPKLRICSELYNYHNLSNSCKLIFF